MRGSRLVVSRYMRVYKDGRERGDSGSWSWNVAVVYYRLRAVVLRGLFVRLNGRIHNLTPFIFLLALLPTLLLRLDYALSSATKTQLDKQPVGTQSESSFTLWSHQISSQRHTRIIIAKRAASFPTAKFCKRSYRDAVNFYHVATKFCRSAKHTPRVE